MASGEVKSAERERRFSRLLVALYKRVLYKERDEALWSDLGEFSGKVIDHFRPLGLELVKDDEAGLAYVRYPPDEGGEDEGIPRLIARRRLSYGMSLILVVLRRKLMEFESSGEGARLIVSLDEIKDELRPYLGESTNEATIDKKWIADLNKIEDELGFVRKLKNSDNQYEVMRVIKAFVDAQWLDDFNEKLKAYKEYGKEGGV